MARASTLAVQRLAVGIAAASGGVYGLGLARFLFELAPQRLDAAGAWPGALLLAALGAAAAVALTKAFRRLAPDAEPFAIWAPIPLALPLISLLSPDVNPLRAATLLLAGPILVLLIVVAPPSETALSQPPNSTSAATPTITRPRISNEFSPRFLSLFPSFFLFLSLFLLFLRTLAPAVGQADTFEFQVGIARLGIAHGSGYPLLMLLGRLFTLLPVGGTLAFRANLTSAFFGALAAVGVERLARRLGAAPLVALLAGLTFGVSPTLWSWAVEVAPYTLNAVFVATLLYLALDYLLLPVSSGGASRSSGIPASATPASSTTLSIKPRTARLGCIREFWPRRISAPSQPTQVDFVPLLQRFQPPGRWSATIGGYTPRLYLLAFLFGLSLTNHLTSLMLAPAIAVAVGLGALRRWRKYLAESEARVAGWHLSSASLKAFLRLAVIMCAFWLLGLSIYLYLPLRWPAVNHGEALSAAQFANILSGNEAKGAFQWRLPFQDPGRYSIVWSKILGEYGWAGVGLALVGVVSLLRRDQGPTRASGPGATLAALPSPNSNYAVLIVLALAYAGYTYFTLAFNVPDPSFSAYFIPLHLIAVLLIALGVQWLITLAASHVQPRWVRAPLVCLVITVFGGLALRSIWRSLPAVDRSGQWASQRLGELMLSQPLRPGAAILADSEKIAPLDYLQIAEGWRPDLDISVLPDEASYRAALDQRLAAGQTVYLGRYLPGLSSVYSLRSVGPLAEVSTKPFVATELALQPSLAQPANSNIRLVGYALPGGGVAAPAELPLTLVWQAQAVPSENLLVNLRLVDAAGQTAWQSAGAVPVSGMYPTNAWRAGEVISDFYQLPVTAGLAPGHYSLQMGLFAPFGPEAPDGWTSVAPVDVLQPAAAPTPPHLLRAQFGPNWLMGYALPAAVAPGSRFTVTLYWLRSDSTQAITALTETHDLSPWTAGQLVPVDYQRGAPADGSRIDLSVDTGQPARCGWLAPPAMACALPSVLLAGTAAAEGAINFDNQILLNHATLETARVAPGGQVKISLEWQGLQSMQNDYTVFVHLLGPDGILHGQVDAWPVSGTRATSGWTPGETIQDPYTVQLPANAPPGPYNVEIGLYLLSTGQRLPVLNADGAPVDDRWLLRGLQVGLP